MRTTNLLLRNVHTLGAALLLTSAALLSSCDQSAIFVSISNETEQGEAFIDGTASKVLEFDGKAWVASGSLYTWDESSSPWASSSGWEKVTLSDPTSGDSMTGIHELALFDANSDGTDDTLFALSISDPGDGSTVRHLYATTDGSTWTDVLEASSASAYPYFEGPLVVTGGNLYLCAHAQDADDETLYHYVLLKYNGSSLDLEAGPYDSAVVGVAEVNSVVYVATAADGIYQSGDSYASAISSTTPDGYELNGMIGLANQLVVVGNDYTSSDEYLWVAAAAGSSTSFSKADRGEEFSGGLDLLDSDSDGTADYLIFGAADGYRWNALSSGDLSTTTASSVTLNDPADEDTCPIVSTEDPDEYDSSLGTVPVMSMSYIAGKLFASTYEEDLWVFNTDEDEWQVID